MRKSGLFAAVLLAVACKGGDGTGTLVPTTIVVTSAPTQIAINETAQASAIVKDQNGEPMTGQAVQWTSLNENIATVTPAGLIRGVAAGTATIQGKIGTLTGAAQILVLAPVVTCAAGPTIVSLNVGQVGTVSSAASSGCIKIASVASASQYIVIGANTNPLPDQLATYTMKSDEGETVPNTTLLASPMRAAAHLIPSPAEMPGSLQASFEAKWRAMERRELNLRSAQDGYLARMSNPKIKASLSVKIPAIGDKATFKVPAKFDANGNYQGGGCSQFTSATATVQYISDRLIVYTDDASPPGGFASSEYEVIAREFDTLIYQTDVDYFGTPLDLDNNGRIIILYTPLVNKLTPAGNPGGFVGGFFFAGDLFPVTGTQTQFGCQQSNVGEIFYALSPDPNGTINGNKRATNDVRQGTRGTIAHEVQHMINASERIRHPVTSEFEATWLDEALAHFAEDLNGRILKGLGETSNVQSATLLSNIDDYNAFFFQNFARLQRYLQNPGPNAPTSQFADSSLADRGAGWALVRYTADHYAPGGDIKAFIRSLVPGPDTGVVNLTSHAGNVAFEPLITDWMVTNYADDAGIPGLDSKYTYKTYDMRDNVARITNGKIYPLVINEVSGSGFSLGNLQARSASGNYFRFTRAAGAPARSFRFLTSSGTAAANFTGATFIVLRTQ